MAASLRGSVGAGKKKEDESSTGSRLGRWISPRYGPFSLGARFEIYQPFISFNFQYFFFGPRPTAVTAVHLYICVFLRMKHKIRLIN